MIFYFKYLVDMVRNLNKGIFIYIWILNEKSLGFDNYVCLIKKKYFYIFYFNGFWLKYWLKYWLRICGIYVFIVIKCCCLDKFKIYIGRLLWKNWFVIF